MKNKIKILLVEDDPNLGSITSEYLNAKGFDCKWEKDGEAGYQKILKEKFDLFVFDVMMPIKDGFTLAKDVRGIDKKTPILFLTAKSMKEDTLKGFEIGADDYVTKPFNIEELIARIKAIINRTKENDNHFDDITIGAFSFNPKMQILKSKDKTIKLTTKESELLILLCKNKNDILERNFALKAVWGDDNYFNGRSMDVYIAKLRKYLKEESNIQIINVHGKGFKLLEEKS
jgi:two-component system, OmpR family, response regulator